LGKYLGVSYFLTLLFGISDHGLRVGVLVDERGFYISEVLLSGGGVSKNIKFEYDVPIVRSDD